MPIYRHTMFMQFNNAAPAVGFSETWAAQWPGDGQARNKMQTLVTERTKVLSSTWTIMGARIGKLSTTGSGSSMRIVESMVAPLNCQNGLPGELGDSDTPWAAILVQFGKISSSTVPKNRPRMEQFRGIPDTWWTAGALSIPAADAAKLQNFYSFLLNPTSFGAGQPVISTTPELIFLNYLPPCLKRISNRRIGRPFGLIRGRKWARRETT